MNIQELADLTDPELISGAMREMQAVAKNILKPGKPDTLCAVIRLLEILEREDVIAATDRLSKRSQKPGINCKI